MIVLALRGVCIAPERHLSAGERTTVDDTTAKFLISIGAVKQVHDEPIEDPKPKRSAKADDKE